MATDIPSIMSHVSIGTNDLSKALAFYDAVLATVGGKRQHEVPGVAVAYGKLFPEYWVQKPLDGQGGERGERRPLQLHRAGPGRRTRFPCGRAGRWRDR